MKEALYILIHTNAVQLKALRTNVNHHMLPDAEEFLEQLNGCLPSGSGIDVGSSINVDESNNKKIVIDTAYHHMNENGMYDGWSDHKIIITPSFISGFDIRVTGRNMKGIKEYLIDLFHYVLSKEVIVTNNIIYGDV